MQRLRGQLPKMYADAEKAHGHTRSRHKQYKQLGVISPFAYRSSRDLFGPPDWEESLEDLAGPEEALLATSHHHWPQQHMRSRGLLLTEKQKQLQKQREQQQWQLQEQQWLVKEREWWVMMCRLQNIAKGVPGVKPDYSWDMHAIRHAKVRNSTASL